jgi:hypothetical protein
MRQRSITVVISDGGVATVGEGAGAPVADPRHIVGIPAQDPRREPAENHTQPPAGP